MEELELKTNQEELAFRIQFLRKDRLNFDQQPCSYLKCSVCQTVINWMLFFKRQMFVHPFLKVPLCEGCFLWLNESKNWNKTCLLCGFIRNEDSNRYCTSCPAIFCQECIKKNFGLAESIKAKFNSAWKCVKCKPKSFWFPRGLCDYAVKFIISRNKFVCWHNNVLKNKGALIQCNFCEVAFKSISILHCKHEFHTECINAWFKKSMSCPLCRVSVNV